MWLFGTYVFEPLLYSALFIVSIRSIDVQAWYKKRVNVHKAPTLYVAVTLSESWR